MAEGKAETRMKNSRGNFNIHNCPICESRNVNKIDFDLYYCLECCSEFNSDGKAYTIQYDGTLTDYYMNEFINCG